MRTAPPELLDRVESASALLIAESTSPTPPSPCSPHDSPHLGDSPHARDRQNCLRSIQHELFPPTRLPFEQHEPSPETPIEIPPITSAPQVAPKALTEQPSTPQETATVGTKRADPGEKIKPVSSAAKAKTGAGQKQAGKARQATDAMNDIKGRNRSYTAARRKNPKNDGFARLDVPIDAAVFSACRDYVESSKPGGIGLMSAFVTEVIVRGLKIRGVEVPTVIAKIELKKRREVK